MSPIVIIAMPICFMHLFVLYQYLTPRENCRNKLILCIAAAFCLQILVRICLISDIHWIQEYNIAKLLTIIMVCILIFLGGRFVYGGWAKIGLYLIVSEIIITIFERTYWQIWGMLTHATPEEIIMRMQMLQPDRVAAIEVLCSAVFVGLFALPARKLRKYPVGRNKFVKAAVILYVILGCTPFAQKGGFEQGNPLPGYFILATVELLFFFAVMMIQREMEQESRNLLQLRHYAFAAQTDALDSQRQRIRRFRHDVKRHLDAMTYLTKARPELENDPSFAKYRRELEQYRDVFRKGYYCDSEEMNASIAQIDQYCAANGISCEIRLRRLRFDGWRRDEVLGFGTLVYNLVTLLKTEDTASMQISAAEENGIVSESSESDRQNISLALSGDEMQGQNILRLDIEYGTGDMADDNKVQNYYLSEIEKILRCHNGSCRREKTENSRSYLFVWR